MFLLWHLNGKLDQILRNQAAILGLLRRGRGPRRVRFSVPQFYDKQGNPIMADFIIPSNQNVNIPLDFSDIGGPDSPPATGASVTTSNPAIATATVAADDGSVNIVSVGVGVGCSVTYTNSSTTPNLTATLVVDVVAPSPTAVAFDTAKATFSPKPAP